MFVCPNCHENYDTEVALTLHKQEKHVGAVGFDLNGVYHSIRAEPEGGFRCPCSFHPMPTLYPTIQELISHIRTVKKWLSNPPPEMVRCISDQLIDTPILVGFSLMINLTNKLLICNSCETAVVVGQVTSHLWKQHQRNMAVAERTLLTQVLGYFNLPAELPSFSGAPIGSIEGLPMYNGFQCSLCTVSYPTPEVLCNHFRAEHRGLRKPAAWKPVHIQQLKPGSHNEYFVVKPKATPQSTLDDLVHAIARCYPLPKNSDMTDADVRNLSPWLRHTRWHELLIGHDIENLRALASQPIPLEFPTLLSAVHHLFFKASGLIDQTPTLVLQILNSPQPSKEITNTPFHHLQNHEDKLRSYILPVIGLAAMLLRDSHVSLPDDIKIQVLIVKTMLATAPLEEAALSIQLLLAMVWERKWTPTDKERITDPTIIYLALSNLQSGGQFHEPKLFTNVIARLEYSQRLLFLCLMHGEPSIDAGLEKHQPWFTEKQESPFNSLRTLQHLASSIAFGTMSLPRVYWTDRKGYRSMLYKGDPVTFDQIHAMIRRLEKRTKSIWEKEVLFSMDLSVKYDFIRDDLSNKDPWYSFLSDPRNTCFDNHNILLSTILEVPALKARFISYHSSGAIVWNTHELRKWLTSYSNFHRDQLARTNLTAGAPSRITELTAMQICNTPEYPLRNLVAMDKHIVLLVTYIKTSAVTGVDRLIPHSLDGFTSDLIIQDLAIARPFAQIAARICHSNHPEIVRMYDTHLFINHTKLFTTTDVTETLHLISQPHFNMAIGVNDWRHISIAFRRMHCSRILDLLDSEDNETISALQSGHRRATENQVYGLSPDMLTGASEDVLPLFLDASTDWQIECKVVPGGLCLPYSSAMMPSFDKLALKGQITLPEKAPSQRLTVQYLDQRLTKLEEKIDAQFESLSNQLQEFFGTKSESSSHFSDRRSGSWSSDNGSSSGGSFSKKRSTLSSPKNSPPAPNSAPGSVSEETSDSSTPRESSDIPKSDVELAVLSILRKLCNNPNATWTCPEQLSGVLAMIELKTDVLALMATGSGKTMLAIIPSLYEKNKITVIIIPFRALIDNYIYKLEEMNVPYELFDPSRPLSGLTNLILVSADAVKTTSWRQAIGETNDRIPVVRQIFDESHIPSTSENFRPALRNMSDIRSSLSAQIVLLSGSVPKSMEAHLIDQFGLSETSFILRTSSNRPELRYVWHKPRMEAAMTDPIKLLIRQHLRKPEDRALIFVPYLRLGETFSNILGYPFYRGGEEEEKGERQILHSAWRAGKPAVMICTSAFGTGLDYAHVRLIVHAGTPFSMLDYFQEVSRGGRDKSAAECALFPARISPPTIDGNDFGGKEYMYRSLSLSPQKCLRHTITSYIDGVGTYCGQSEANQVCSVCDVDISKAIKRGIDNPFDISVEESSKRLRSRKGTELEYVANVKAQLSKFANCCTFCVIAGEQSGYHTILSCPTLRLSVGKKEYLAWKGAIKYKRRGICWKCHIPNGPKDSLHGEFEKGKVCTYDDLVGPLIFAILLHPHLKSELEVHFKVAFKDAHGAITWLTDLPVSGGHESNFIAVLIWYASRY